MHGACVFETTYILSDRFFRVSARYLENPVGFSFENSIFYAMICSMKRFVTTMINGSNLFLRKRSPTASIRQSLLLLSALHKLEQLTLSVSKPLHVSSVENLSLRARRDSIKCEAYEAVDQLKLVEPEVIAEAAQKVKIGVYFATWWERTMAFDWWRTACRPTIWWGERERHGRREERVFFMIIIREMNATVEPYV